jgi:CHASE3 domain sensor protein
MSVSDRKHLEDLRKCDQELALAEDRRYTEVAEERAKALKIKEEADAKALDLQREVQQYKDEKANELRSQIERERGSMATKDDLANLAEKIEAQIKPLVSQSATSQGRTGGLNAGWGYLVGGVGLIASLIGAVVLISPH